MAPCARRESSGARRPRPGSRRSWPSGCAAPWERRRWALSRRRSWCRGPRSARGWTRRPAPCRRGRRRTRADRPARRPACRNRRGEVAQPPAAEVEDQDVAALAVLPGRPVAEQQAVRQVGLEPARRPGRACGCTRRRRRIPGTRRRRRRRWSRPTKTGAPSPPGKRVFCSGSPPPAPKATAAGSAERAASSITPLPLPSSAASPPESDGRATASTFPLTAAARVDTTPSSARWGSVTSARAAVGRERVASSPSSTKPVSGAFERSMDTLTLGRRGP